MYKMLDATYSHRDYFFWNIIIAEACFVRVFQRRFSEIEQELEFYKELASIDCNFTNTALHLG